MATQHSAAQDLAEAQPQTSQTDDFAALLTREFRPRSERAGEEVRLAVRTLAEQVLERSDIISDDLAQTINAYVAEIDRKISEQLNLILHAPQFQALEGAWRGLHYLVSNTESDTQLKIRVLNVSKRELAKNLKRFKGTAWDQSPVFKKIYEAEYGQLGGEPYGCLIGDYHFDHSPQDVDTLRGISQIAAASHAPFIAAAGPGLMGMESWSELSNPRDLAKIFSTPDYAAWRSLRQSEDAKYLALAMPRTLARLPYGVKTDPVEAFDFEEDTQGADSSCYTWQNAAYAMAVNINRSFKQYGWCTRIRGVESGGAVEGLPTHTFPADDGGVDMKCPTEVAITDRRCRTRQDGSDAAGTSQEHRHGSLHQRAVAGQARGIRRPGCHRQRGAERTPAVYVRLLPLRALFEVHRARQDRLVQHAPADAELVDRLGDELRRRRPGQFQRRNQGA